MKYFIGLVCSGKCDIVPPVLRKAGLPLVSQAFEVLCQAPGLQHQSRDPRTRSLVLLGQGPVVR